MSGEVAKYHRYFVYDPDCVFLTEWTDVISDYRYTDEINTMGGPLEVTLGRSARNNQIALSNLLDETGDTILDEDGNAIVTEDSVTFSVGEGTDIDANNCLRVYEYYGGTDTILDEAGDVILDEDGLPIFSEYGALDGRRVFNGYISKWKVVDNANGKNILVTALPLSTDYSDIIFENFFWSYVTTTSGATVNYNQDLVKYNGTDRYTVAQTFVAPATGPTLQLLVYYTFPSDAYLFGITTITYQLYTGNNPNGARTLLYSGTQKFDFSPYSGFAGWFALNVVDGPELTSGSSYHIELSVNKDRSINGNAPIQVLSTNSGYSGGSYWTRTGASTTYVEDTAKDLAMQIEVLINRATKATYSGWTLRNFIDQTMDLVAQRGGRVNANNPTDDRIEDPGVNLPTTDLNVNTYKDRMDVAVKAAPYGWYYRYDHAANAVIFQSRHDSADHTFRAGVHIQAIDVEWDTEQIFNVVYFTGGPYPTATDPPLYRRYADPSSIARYGTKARSVTDGRITVPASADIRGESTTTNLTTEASNEQTAKPCTTINCCVQRPIDEPADSDRWAGRSPSEGSFVGTYCYQRVNDGTGQGGLVTVDFAPFDQAAQPPPPSPAQLAQQAIDQILVPPPHIGAGPDRTKLAVNLWTWLWIDAEAPLLRQSHPVVFQ